VRRAAAVLVLLLLPAPALARELHLTVGQTLTVPFPGTTAAFAVDPAIVEATARPGELVLIGRRVGQSPVTVVAAAGTTETVVVRVTEPAGKRQARAPVNPRRRGGTVEGRYDSGTGRISTSLGLRVEDGERSARLRLFGISESGGRDGESLRAIPSVSLELVAPGRSLILLDQFVESSPLTLDGVVLRGLHLQRAGFSLHGGVATSTPWNDLLIASDGERALGISYALDRRGFRFAPSLLWLPDAIAAHPGAVSLAIERGAAGDALHGRAEIGWSDRPGGALDLELNGGRQRVWFEGQHRPEGFAALDVAKPPGTFLDGAWSGSFGERISADLTVSGSRLDLTGQRQQAHSERLELRYRAADHWSLTAGAGAGGYENLDRNRAAIRRLTGSLGASYDGLRLGVAGLYRYQEVSAASRGGHGGRLTLRAGKGQWRGHMFFDAQQEAPTLDLVLRSRPGLERALAELGFAARSPEELVRLLRDNAILFAERGVQIGALELDPLRLNGGFDVAWRGSRSEVGFRLVVDDSRAIDRHRSTYLATLSASRRVFGDTDLILGYTRWATTIDGSRGGERDSLEVAVRTQIPEIQGIPGIRRGIRGTVWRDDLATGDYRAGALPLGGVSVVLDGKRTTQSDSSGRFGFDHVGGGVHRVEVVLPSGAYFTTPSVLSVPAGGGDVVFGLAYSAARLKGRVRTDAGQPLPGVTVRLEGGISATATTDSSGTFLFAAAGGEARLSVVADSLPPGFDLSTLQTETVRLQVGAPATRDLEVRAHRTVAGTLRTARPREATITVEGLGQTVTPSANGQFILRGLPAGKLTLVARAAGGEDREVVEVPPEPATLGGIVLEPRKSAGASPATAPRG
jgi:hypothetical protein